MNQERTYTTKHDKPIATRTANIGNVASVPQQIVGHYLGGLVFWAKLVTPLWPEHRNRRGGYKVS